MKLLTLYDKAFIAFILLLSLTGFIINFRLDARVEQKYITIWVDNEFVMELSFTEESEEIVQFRFGPNREHTATLEIREGRVRMLPINEELCPRGICSHTGWISRNYQSIVCIPNRIVVAFSDRKLEEVDGVTY